MPDDRPFWRRKPLSELSPTEWESLCDGCARCCLEKLQDMDTGRIHYTDVACSLLNIHTCRCSDYPNRQRHMPDCQRLTPQSVPELHWLPSTCAYRLLAAGGDLPSWHPLITGDRHSPHLAGMSVRGRAIPARVAGRLEDHLVEWPR